MAGEEGEATFPKRLPAEDQGRRAFATADGFRACSWLRGSVILLANVRAYAIHPQCTPICLCTQALCVFLQQLRKSLLLPAQFVVVVCLVYIHCNFCVTVGETKRIHVILEESIGSSLDT